MTDLVAVMSKAMQESKAWPVVFSNGSAEELSRAALAAIEAEGFAVVQKEPTEAMHEAASPPPRSWDWAKIGRHVRQETALIRAEKYRAMIEAGRIREDGK